MCGKKAMESLDAKLAALNVQKGPVLDIYMYKKATGQQAKTVKALSQGIVVAFDIPAGMKGAEKEFAVVRVSENGEVAVLKDMDSNADSITFVTDKFGVFCLVYGPEGYFDILP